MAHNANGEMGWWKEAAVDPHGPVQRLGNIVMRATGVQAFTEKLAETGNVPAAAARWLGQIAAPIAYEIWAQASPDARAQAIPATIYMGVIETGARIMGFFLLGGPFGVAAVQGVEGMLSQAYGEMADRQSNTTPSIPQGS